MACCDRQDPPLQQKIKLAKRDPEPIEVVIGQQLHSQGNVDLRYSEAANLTKSNRNKKILGGPKKTEGSQDKSR